MQEESPGWRDTMGTPALPLNCCVTLGKSLQGLDPEPAVKGFVDKVMQVSQHHPAHTIKY